MTSEDTCVACILIKNCVNSNVIMPHSCGKKPGRISQRDEMEQPEKEIQHQWTEGKWKQEGRHKTREDKCVLCGCVRIWVKWWHKGEVHTEISQYERSKIVFGDQSMPACWGGRNPK
jgi:hypothetical protein